jgi:hypothetical protein
VIIPNTHINLKRGVKGGVHVRFGVFYIEFLEEFGEGKGQTAWIGSLVPGVTLLVGKLHVVKR